MKKPLLTLLLAVGMIGSLGCACFKKRTETVASPFPAPATTAPACPPATTSGAACPPGTTQPMISGYGSENALTFPPQYSGGSTIAAPQTLQQPHPLGQPQNPAQ